MENRSSMQPVRNASRQLGFLPRKKMKASEKIDTFFGFWKMLGLTGSFLIGIVLFWWGVKLYLSQSFYTGFDIVILLMPLAMGLTLVLFSFAEFLRIIRE